jgi:hypothetical protein
MAAGLAEMVIEHRRGAVSTALGLPLPPREPPEERRSSEDGLMHELGHVQQSSPRW